VNPSPNMRGLTEATLYPGVGLLEFTALSVGRGTDTPFEIFGAPYVDDLKLAATLNRAGLSGVRFVPVRFTPTGSVFKNQRCGGVSIVLTDRTACRVVDIGIAAAAALHALYPADFDLKKFNVLLGDEKTLSALEQGAARAAITQPWAESLSAFKKRREKFLLYK